MTGLLEVFPASGDRLTWGAPRRTCTARGCESIQVPTARPYVISRSHRVIKLYPRDAIGRPIDTPRDAKPDAIGQPWMWVSWVFIVGLSNSSVISFWELLTPGKHMR